jgi:hypothetical protein
LQALACLLARLRLLLLLLLLPCRRVGVWCLFCCTPQVCGRRRRREGPLASGIVDRATRMRDHRDAGMSSGLLPPCFLPDHPGCRCQDPAAGSRLGHPASHTVNTNLHQVRRRALCAQSALAGQPCSTAPALALLCGHYCVGTTVWALLCGHCPHTPCTSIHVDHGAGLALLPVGRMSVVNQQGVKG